MSDADRIYEVIWILVQDCLPNMRLENQITLAQMVTGILRSANVQFRKIAQKLRYKGKKSSLVDKFRRFVRNNNISVEAAFLPFIEMILEALNDKEIILMIDTSKVGGNCLVLMLSVYYQGRALPLCWAVFKGKKGHSSSALQLELLNYIIKLLPTDANIILLGDGEFDSSDVIKWLEDKPNWQYVCRTATNIKVFFENEWVSLSELPLIDEEEAFFCAVLFTESASVGPVNIMAVWNEKEKCHWFMVTNVSTRLEAKKWYGFRFTIETLFSDVKGRGFNIDKTGLNKPERVNRLILAASIAYVFTIVLGVESIVNDKVGQLAREGDSKHETYYSLFQLGLMYLDHLLNECLPFPTFIRLISPDELHPKHVT